MLRARYRAASVGTPVLFESIAERLVATPGSVDVLDELLRELHRVRGTAGSYGFMDVSQLAGALEARVAGWRADPGLDRETRVPAIEAFAVALRRCFGPDAPPQSAGASGSVPDQP